jgi:hypothetical protein
VETADQDQSSIAWKDLVLPEKCWSMMTTGQSALKEASVHETAKCQEPAPSLLPVLEQLPLSSSHQDHLLVEETEAYSSGGRETLACLEEPFTSVLPPSVEDDPVNQGMIVSCTDEQQTYVTQPANELVDVLVEVSQQEDPSSRTKYGMEIRGADSRIEAVKMELPDSFVVPGDSSMVSMQVDCQGSPKPYYVDSSMQSPEVTIGNVVGELNFVNQVASLSSTHAEQEVEEAYADALLLSADEVFVKQRTRACCTDQPMDSRMGQTDASSLWIEEGCWIYIIQDANGRQWERSCWDLQIHHVQPD